MDIGSAAIVLVGTLLLLVVPGGALAHVLGFRGLWWLAATPAFSIAAIGVAGIVAAPLRIPFAWWEPTVLVAVACGGVLGSRALRHRRLLRPAVGRWSRPEIVLVVVVLACAAVAGVIAATGVGSWSRISQTYDGLFHLNAVAWIQSTGDASSFDLYRITHPGTGNEFYPAAWHALVASTVQLTGSSIPVATNATWFAVQSAIWFPGIAVLAGSVARSRWRRAAGGATAIASIGLTGFPDLLLAWGTLYPTALAYALLPIGVALTLRIMHWVAGVASDGRLPVPVAEIAGFGIWLIASALAHPRSLFSFVVIAIPAVVYEGARAIRAIWRRPHWRRRIVATGTVVVVAIAGIATVGVIYVYRAYDLAHRPIADHLNGGPATATQGIPASLVQALTLAPVDPSGSGALPASWLLAALVVVGLVVAAIHARTRWLVVAWVLAVAFYALAAGSNSELSKVLTGVWYKDKFRLFAMLPVIQGPLIALGVTGVLAAFRGRSRCLVRAITIVVLAAAVATSSAVLAAPAMIRTVFALPAHDKGGRAVDGDEYRLLERLPEYVPAGAVVAGDPWDGSTLSWAIGDRRALFPHLAGEWSPDEILVAAQLDRVLTDPAVCAAVQRLGIHWVVEDPQLLWGKPAEAAPFDGFHRAARERALTPVLQIGSAGLYRIPACRS